MPRLSHVDPATATGEAKELLDRVEAALGGTPNTFTTLAAAPAALEGYLTFSGALDKSALPAAVRAQIAIAVAEATAPAVASRLRRRSAGRLDSAKPSSPPAAEPSPATREAKAALNYFNHVVQTAIDFPMVEPAAKAA